MPPWQSGGWIIICIFKKAAYRPDEKTNVSKEDIMLEQSYYEKVDEIIAVYGAKSSSLIPIIQDIQANSC